MRVRWVLRLLDGVPAPPPRHRRRPLSHEKARALSARVKALGRRARTPCASPGSRPPPPSPRSSSPRSGRNREKHLPREVPPPHSLVAAAPGTSAALLTNPRTPGVTAPGRRTGRSALSLRRRWCGGPQNNLMFRSGPSARACLAVSLPRARRSRNAGGVSRRRRDSHIVNLYSSSSGPSRGLDRRTYHSSSVARRSSTSASCRPNSCLFLSLRCASRPSSGAPLCTSNGPRCRGGHTSSSRAAGTPSPRRRRPFVFCAFAFGCAFWLCEPSSAATAKPSRQRYEWV